MHRYKRQAEKAQESFPEEEEEAFEAELEAEVQQKKKKKTKRRVMATATPSDPLIDASLRINPKNGQQEKTPIKRKAPAGHAKDFSGETAVGGDGGLWKSEMTKNFVWRWQKVYEEGEDE